MLHDFAAAGVHTNQGDLEDALRLLAGDGAVDLARLSMRASLMRAIETSVMALPEVIAMLRSPEVYLGTEAEVLEEALASVDPRLLASESTVRIVKEIVAGRVARAASKTRTEDVAAREFIRRANKELRCDICGYHFLESNLGADRLARARAAPVVFASEVPLGRLADPWKPSTSENCMLTVDHVIPEGALGPTIDSNIRFLCKLCNRRRQIMLRWPEAWPSRMASSLMTIVGGDRGFWAVEAAVLFKLCETPQCAEGTCSTTSMSGELTAVPTNGDRRWTGLQPWNLEVRCYAHTTL